MYPTLEITSGKVHIEDEIEDGQDDVSVSSMASSNHTEYKPVSINETQGQTASEAFKDRRRREKIEAEGFQGKEIAKLMEDNKPYAAKRPSTSTPYSRQSQHRQERPSAAPKVESTVTIEGEGLWATEKEKGKPARFWLDLEGGWDHEGESDEACQEREQDRSRRHTTGEKSRRELEDDTITALEHSVQALQNLEDLARGHAHTMTTRSQAQTAADAARAKSMFPLMSIGEGNHRYKPFSIGDVQTIVDKLPPVSEGGNLWLSKLDSLTAGHKLALGDFRAVAGRCLTGGDMRDVETQARTIIMGDEVPFTCVSTAVGRVMREKYPLPNGAVMPKMKWDPKQNPREYIDYGKDMWLKYTGKAGSQREWF